MINNFARKSRANDKIDISDEWDSYVSTNFHFLIIGKIAAVAKAVFQFAVDYLQFMVQRVLISSFLVVVHCHFN